jgi:L-threonylcarbamoyladenylate synthase
MTPADRILAPSPTSISRAAEALLAGELVAFPTETVYGLGGDATNARAVARIFEAKGRPAFNPLIAHVADPDAARELVEFNATADALAEKFWPGPLTLVLPMRAECPVAPLATSGLATLAVRVPAGEIAHALLSEVGRPVAAPSANRSGRLSPTRAEHVAEDMGDAVTLIIDGGPCRIGVESTVVGFDGDRPVLLRPGGIPLDALEAAAGPVAEAGADAPVSSPGMLTSHYAPARPLRPNATGRRDGEALLGFGPEAEGADLNLSPAGDLVEAAANLFAMLRALDSAPFTAIAVSPIPDEGLGRAINDRISRAAAPRQAGERQEGAPS